MERVGVFCGSSLGARPGYVTAAHELGRTLARRGLGLVYGGGAVGLMGELADAALAEGGWVVGVIPDALLAKEVGHRALPDLRVVGSMHERKALMADLADGFIALPGGFGTLDEFCEIVTWAQLGYHRKPCAILNVDGYFDAFLRFLDDSVTAGFVRAAHRDMLVIDDNPARLLDRMAAYQPPTVVKWLRRDAT